MQSHAPSAEHRNPLVRAADADAPVLIFELDAAGIDQPAAPARRCEIRLVGCVPDRPPHASNGSRGSDVSAVLILRAMTPSRLLACVRAVTAGRATMSPELLCQLLPEPEGDAAEAARERLTHREFDVLRRLAEGDSTRAIAERMSYSERTVKNIVHDLMTKLNCRTRAQAVALATRQGVI